MKKLAILFAVGAAALLAGSPAGATVDNSVKASANESAQTDVSARRRHWRHRHYRIHRSYYAPYYRSYGYAPEPYYYGGGPFIGAPVISFGIGGGRWGGGWGHRHRHW